MAVSIKELIEQKEAIASRKKQTFDLDTSIGIITVKQPTRAFVAEAMGLEEGHDDYLILHSVIEPNLKSEGLQEAFGCSVPTDIVEKLFQSGEIGMIASKIMQCAGYRKDIKAEVHEVAKN